MSEPRRDTGERVDRVLGAPEAWARIQARNERALLELDRLVAQCFDGVLTSEQRRHGAEVCAALCDAFAELSLGVGVDHVARVAAPFDADRPEPPGPAEAERLSVAVEDLHNMLTATGSEAPGIDADMPLLVVVGPPTRFTDAVAWLATTRALRVVHDTKVSDAVRESAAEAACVVVATGDDDPDALASRLSEVAECFAGRPFVLCTPSADITTRLAAAQHVTSALIDVAPAEVVGEVHALIDRRSAPSAIAVYAADPEPLVRDLARRGLNAEPFVEVADLFGALRARRVHAVLVGADLDPATRAAVPALVRSDPATRAVGIVSLGDVGRTAQAVDVIRAGADVVLPAQVDRDVLAACCNARLRHALDLSTRAAGDRNGLLAQQQASLRIDAMLVGAHRRRTLVSLAVMGVEGDDVDEADVGELAEMLGREFRRDDVIGRWPDGRFVIGLNGVSRRVAVRRFEELLGNFSLGERCRVGVAEFPHDGRVLDELMSSAEWSILRARVGEGPTVVSSEWRVDLEERPDVLVVDPDVTLRALIVTLLERQGLTVVQATDGVAALEHLTGPQHKVLPRVLLLELDLTGIDGLQLLRRLDETGVMSRLRALVLTARIRESELLEALALGASDVVTKPFSPALLVHRLRRVLES